MAVRKTNAQRRVNRTKIGQVLGLHPAITWNVSGFPDYKLPRIFFLWAEDRLCNYKMSQSVPSKFFYTFITYDGFPISLDVIYLQIISNPKYLRTHKIYYETITHIHNTQSRYTAILHNHIKKSFIKHSVETHFTVIEHNHNTRTHYTIHNHTA